MTKGQPHIDYTKFDTISIGNRIAREIIANGPRPNYNATLRHALANGGPDSAAMLACNLLKVDDRAAREIIAKLSTTKSDDIISPHYEE